MAKYKVKAMMEGHIVIDGVDDYSQAEEYAENSDCDEIEIDSMYIVTSERVED